MGHIGIYSGTFDPVHAGHLAFADEAQRIGRLERVVFMPEQQPRGKVRVSALEQRIDTLRTQLAATDHEVHHASQSRFTIAETLPELEGKYRGITLSFLMGSDIVPSLPGWPHIERLLRYQLLIGMRSNDRQESVIEILDQLGATYRIITTSYAHVSSRQLRGQGHSLF